MIYTKGQQEAIEKALKWYYLYSYKKRYFILGGLAGTGKSTVISAIVERLNLPKYHKVIYATFTAKASLVLRKQGLDSNTIHSTFYYANKDKRTGKTYFTKRHTLDESIRLIVVDEAAMVSDRLIEDILSFGIPTILSGDPSQLGPIMAKNTYMFDYNKMDALLTEIMRQDDESGILRLATLARTGGGIHYGTYNESKVTKLETLRDKLLEFDAILTWRNSTRRSINNFIRKHLLKRKTSYPIKGDKVLCLNNNYNYSIEYEKIGLYLINGLVGIVSSDFEESYYEGEKCLEGCFYPDFLNEKNGFHIYCYKQIFDMYKKEIFNTTFERDKKVNEDDEEQQDMMSMMDYGYALTVHKAQGSGFDNVLVIDEYRGGYEFRKKWLYTAITRAKKKVVIATP